MAARKRKAAEPTPEQWQELAAAAMPAIDPETVEKIRESVNIPVPPKFVIDSANFESAMHKITEMLTRRLEPLQETISGILENTEKILDKFAQTIDDGLSVRAKLAPYIKAEVEEHPDEYRTTGITEFDTETAENLIINAADRAGADGIELTQVKKEFGRRKKIREAAARKELAQQAGALFPKYDNLPIIAIKSINSHQFFTKEAIKHLPESTKESVRIEEDGSLLFLDLNDNGSGGSLEEINTPINTVFLLALLAYANEYISEVQDTNGIMTISVPHLLNYIHKDPRVRAWSTKTEKLSPAQYQQQNLTSPELRYHEFMKLIDPFKSFAGIVDNSIYQVVGFYGYDTESETAQLTVPYLIKLIEFASRNAGRNPDLVFIFHGDMSNENPAAVEVAIRIGEALLKRWDLQRTYKDPPTIKKKRKTTVLADGTKVIEENEYLTDTTTVTKTYANGIQKSRTGPTPQQTTKRPKYEVKFTRLIKECPQLYCELESIKTRQGEAERAAIESGKTDEEIAAARRRDHATDPQRTNKKLKDIFTAVIRILTEKSDFPMLYTNFRIVNFRAPTNSTLNSKLVIDYDERNPNYTLQSEAHKDQREV